MTRDQLIKGLGKYIPSASVSLLADWIVEYGVNLRVTRARSTKLGDYRHPFDGEGHRITVNFNLNPYAFLITLVHEIAHLTTYNKYKNRVPPHGTAWKEEYKTLMRQVVKLNVFPPDVYDKLVAYMQNPAASSCSDEELLRTLRLYDEGKKDWQHLEELPAEAIFELENGMLMKKGEKLRKRYKCLELRSKRYYFVSPLAEVKKVENTQH